MNKTVQAELISTDESYKIIDLPALLGSQLDEFPYVLRLLIENCARHSHITDLADEVQSFERWLVQGSSHAEISFYPGRILMHDTTSTPALVDLAAMRDELAQVGHDPAVLNPVLPVEVSVDHSLAV